MIYIGGMAGFLNVSAGRPALIRVKKRSFHDIALSGAQISSVRAQIAASARITGPSGENIKARLVKKG